MADSSSVPNNKKRKRPTAAAAAAASSASPGPSEPGQASSVQDTSDAVLSRADLFTRPQLSISRGPIFVPDPDGSEYFKTDLVGVQAGFRYSPAGINPPGSVLPCRTIESNPTSYRVSWEDRSPFLRVSKDGLGLLGTKGYRSARCNAPIREGKWYMEVTIKRGGGDHASDDGRRDGSHVRLGFGRREAPLNGPAGLDGYSYGFRDKTGEKVTLSRPRPYGRPASTGDVIGMYISLPPRRQPDPHDPHDPAHLKRERIAIDLKGGQEVFEMLEYAVSKEMVSLMDYSGKATNSTSLPSTSTKKASGKLPERGPATKKVQVETLRELPTLPGSYISFFINGECQGIAFQDIYDYLVLRAPDNARKVAQQKKRVREGVKQHTQNPFDDGTLGYYPFISLFNEACVQLNPGPDFAFPPPPDVDAVLSGSVATSEERTWRPLCERYPEFMQEQWDQDKIDEAEARVEFDKSVERERAEAAKKAARDKKKEQADARKRAKKAAAEQAQADSDRFYSMTSMGQPSPLRHGTAFSFDGSVEPPENSSPTRSLPRSPAPTFLSNGGGHSGQASEYGDAELEEGGYEPWDDATASEPQGDDTMSNPPF